MTSRARNRGTQAAWTTARLAAEIGMSDKFVRGEIAAGEIKAVKVGREWRIPFAEVARYCRQIGWPVPEAAVAS